MNSDDIDALIHALRASPNSPALLAVVLRTCAAAGDTARAATAVDIADLTEAPAQVRLTSARALAAVGRTQDALDLLADSPDEQLERARLLLALGQRRDADAAYRAAIAANATLDDPALAAALSGKVVAFAGAERNRKQHSVANDDTDQTEVVRLLHPEIERVAFEHVAGLDNVKQQIRRRIISPFLKPSLFQRFKRNAGGGILMYGPPGCGKTLLARATAGECGARFFNVAINDVLDMYIGESERKLHAIFEQARASSPAVVFFDEVEALGGKRQFTRESTSSKLVSLFLSELDGFAQNNQGVLIIGATNVPWAIDPAFRRPGRFDRIVFVPPPDRQARTALLSRLLEERPNTGCDVQALVARSSGFSGADLRNLVETAADLAIEESLSHREEVPIRHSHLVDALDEVRSTTGEWLTTARNYARYSNDNRQYDDVLQFLDQQGRK